MTDHIEFKPTPKDIGQAGLAVRPNNRGRCERWRIVIAGAVILNPLTFIDLVILLVRRSLRAPRDFLNFAEEASKNAEA